MYTKVERVKKRGVSSAFNFLSLIFLSFEAESHVPRTAVKLDM